jgi:hypothetical protein
MRKVFWATAFVMGFAVAANAAMPSTQQEGVVTQVNRAGGSFIAQSYAGTNSTFKTTQRTLFRVGTTPTSWAAVKVGSKVGVVYHLDGQSPVADEVVIAE